MLNSLSNVQFIKGTGLFRVLFKQVSLYLSRAFLTADNTRALGWIVSKFPLGTKDLSTPNTKVGIKEIRVKPVSLY
jgi:hypothetical protein